MSSSHLMPAVCRGQVWSFVIWYCCTFLQLGFSRKKTLNSSEKYGSVSSKGRHWDPVRSTQNLSRSNTCGRKEVEASLGRGASRSPCRAEWFSASPAESSRAKIIHYRNSIMDRIVIIPPPYSVIVPEPLWKSRTFVQKLRHEQLKEPTIRGYSQITLLAAGWLLSWWKIWAAHHLVCYIFLQTFTTSASFSPKIHSLVMKPHPSVSSLDVIHGDTQKHLSFANHSLTFLLSWDFTLLLRMPWDITNVSTQWTYNEVVIMEVRLIGLWHSRNVRTVHDCQISAVNINETCLI